jgi:hypothetical protein
MAKIIPNMNTAVTADRIGIIAWRYSGILADI